MPRRCAAIALVVPFSLTMAASSAFAAEVGYYSRPALHGNRIVFVSEGDLWTAIIPEPSASPTPAARAPAATNAGTAGGAANEAPIIAHRLTSSEGSESNPVISPDGNSLAFSAEYDGNADVYVMPITGGAPKRLTFHPGPDAPVAWMPDGQTLLFTSARNQPLGRPELWRVAPQGSGGAGMPQRYEFGECTMIALSSSGKRFAFTRWSNENWTWKRYRGGTAPEIWLGELDSGTFSKLTSNDANDLFPMWLLGRVFFLSDRAGTANIFSAAADGAAPERDVKQHTKFAPKSGDPAALDGYDARWPSADAQMRGTRIIFCQAGGLALLDARDDSIRRLDVRLASDRVAARQRFAPLAETLTEFTISPDGKQLVVGSRGELVLIDVESGDPLQLTRSAGAREWGATWLEDDQIALITDISGEQQIAVMPVPPTESAMAPGQATDVHEAWLFPPATSADGNQIAFGDKTLRLHIIDMKTLERRQVDQSEAGEITDYRFSPDSQWLAYTKPMPNGFGMVHIYSVRSGRSFAVSAGLYNDSHPRWDPAGKHLYFLSNRHLNPVMSEFDFEHGFMNTTEVYAVPLAAATPPPLKAAAKAADFDLEKWAKAPEKEDEEKDGKDKKPAEGAAADEAADQPPADPNAPPPDSAPMRVDTDGIAQRHYLLPIEHGNYSNLEALWGGIGYVSNPTEGLMDDPWPNPPKPRGSLVKYDFVKEKSENIAEKLNEFVISEDRSTLAWSVMNDEGEVASITVKKLGGKGEPDSVKLADLQIRIDVPAEWKQIFHEAWRLQRDFYWAPNYVGVDWPAMQTKYAALLPRLGTRNELNDLVGQMIGELGTSHTYIWGGQQRIQAEPIGVGMLGADIQFDGRGFKIARIIPGAPWGETYRSPLEAAYLNVKEGNYILAINGMPLTPGVNIYDLLQDQADKIVHLRIADDAGGRNARTIEVKTRANEIPLRYAAWVEANRRYVEEKSGGKIGYLHIPDMGGQGLVMFSRLFYPQSTKPALIIDIRDNGGGFVSQMIVERLARKLIAFDQPRHGVTARYPMRALHAHLATIIDQHAGSDGDIFPAAFRALGLGPLIGTRTWGGVVGVRGDKPFVDMGLSTQPEFAWWEAEAGWSIENRGVSPDIEVEQTPGDRAAGRDPQLDRAIEHLLKKLEEEPKNLPPVPPFPVRMK